MKGKNHYKAIEQAESYALEHPEMEKLIHCFIKMSRHPKVMCKIQMGRYSTSEGKFVSKLTSNIRFAAVRFSFIGEDITVEIKNHSESVCTFYLTEIGNIYCQKNKSVPKPLLIEQETYILGYNGDDYKLSITFEERHINK